LDEAGYLLIDQRRADLLFRVISQRYERGSIVITSNKAFKQWRRYRFNRKTRLPSFTGDCATMGTAES
jgi:DNA replication protein DnaC